VPEPPAVERLLGLERYATRAPGIGGKLRVAPEDFVVDEIPKPPSPARGAGKYTIATLRATNWETNRLVREIGQRLGVGRRGIFFTGTKDKRAVKTQQMAILAPEAAVKELRISGVDVLATFRADHAPKLGDLIGNRFGINVHQLACDVDEAGARCAAVEAELREVGGVPNFFGLQRFGSLRPVTQRIGERMVRGDFAGAVMAYVGEPVEGEPAEAFEARRRIGEERDFVKAVTYYPRHLSFERVLVEHLAKSADDWIGALRRLPQNLVTMFVYAYQSQLFNRMLSARLERFGSLREITEGDILLPVDTDGVPDHDILIPVRKANLDKCQFQVKKGRATPTGLVFGLDVPYADGEMGAIERRIVAAEQLSPEDFRIPSMPEVASFGQRRALVVEARDYDRAAIEGGVHVSFRLPKGSYATCLLREFMKTDARNY
jgi:tRNA pseudouridine13 synthase